MKAEDSLTIAVSNYIKMQYPKVFFTHIANERKTSIIHGAKLKRMGLCAGLPDLLIFERKYDKAGLFIELKIGKNKPTELQTYAMNELKRNGWIGNICYDFESSQLLIDNYLK